MQSPLLTPMAVIGAGSWGTALAIQCARAGHPTRLWGRDAALIDIDAPRPAQSRATCPTPNFRRALEPVADLAAGARGCARCAGRGALARLSRDAPRASSRLLDDDARIAWASKGFEMSSGLLPHEVAREVFGRAPGAVLSGPTFAREVGAGLPTAMTVASRDADFAQGAGVAAVGTEFRAYTQSDIVGVEVGGAVKNVIAIGSGDRRRHGLRRQHARRADHPRSRGDDCAWACASARSATRSWVSRRSAIWS